MRSEPTDTSPETERALIEAIRQAPVWKRIALVCDLIDASRALALADLRRQHPAASEEELRRRLAFRLLPPEDVKRAYGWEPYPDER
jgi:hypothetical protein